MQLAFIKGLSQGVNLLYTDRDDKYCLFRNVKDIVLEKHNNSLHGQLIQITH